MASQPRLSIFPVLVATEMLTFASLAFISAIRGLKIADYETCVVESSNRTTPAVHFNLLEGCRLRPALHH